MSTGAAGSGEITPDVKNQFISQPLEEFTTSCQNDLQNHKYDVVKSGLKIANKIMNEFISTRMSAAVQGQRPMADPQDMFVMMQVLAKTNAALLSLAERGKHHEKHTRTIGSKFGDIDVV